MGYNFLIQFSGSEKGIRDKLIAIIAILTWNREDVRTWRATSTYPSQVVATKLVAIEIFGYREGVVQLLLTYEGNDTYSEMTPPTKTVERMLNEGMIENYGVGPHFYVLADYANPSWFIVGSTIPASLREVLEQFVPEELRTAA